MKQNDIANLRYPELKSLFCRRAFMNRLRSNLRDCKSEIEDMEIKLSCRTTQTLLLPK